MRRMLLLACAAGLCGTVAVVAFAADSSVVPREGQPTPGRHVAPPESGPFAVASAGAASDAADERGRAAWASAHREGYADHDYGEYRPSSAPRPASSLRSRRVRVIGGVARRLGIDRMTMSEAVLDVRRQIAPRAWSDARDEALRMLARELGLPFADVKRAVRSELRDEFRGPRP